MSRGISLHIGLNYVDPAAYGGWDGALSGCINDATDMRAIADSRGFESSSLIDGEAISANVVAKISQAAEQLQAGDIFLITYSGHGGQLPDADGNEEDLMDETWVLYDRELLDDELYRLWSRFRKGVRIFVTSDSCHSGTVVKAMLQLQMRQIQRRERGKFLENIAKIDITPIKAAVQEKVQRSRNIQLQAVEEQKKTGKPRFIPVQFSLPSFIRRKEEYSYIKAMAGPRSTNPLAASLIYISGCQDNQYSYDGDENGQFTGELLRVWQNGNFNGSHAAFYSSILAKMPDYQTPNYMKLGEELPGFEAQKPYTIQFATSGNGAGTTTDVSNTGGGSISGGAEPRVNGPASWNRNQEAPVFTIYKGANPYYYFEICSDYRLFDSQTQGSQRNNQNFYATWQDPAVHNRLTNSEFKLPESVWNLLKQADKLYFRIGTTSSSDIYQWENFMVSTYDKEGSSAPSMEIVSQPAVPAGGGGGSTTESGGVQEQSISASVGRNAVNKREDVKTIQKLLNRVSEAEGGPVPGLVVDGLIGSKTIGAIMRFQEYNYQHTSGVIYPGSTTLLLLQSSSKAVAQQAY